MKCPDCKKPITSPFWCKPCNSKRLEKNFINWTSGNKFIDELIQNYQLEAKSHKEVIEFIPYNRLKNINFLATGGFSTIYRAIWMDGYLYKWEGENWKRIIKDMNINNPLEKSGIHVALKVLNNFDDGLKEFLSEVNLCLVINNFSYSVYLLCIYIILFKCLFSGKIISNSLNLPKTRNPIIFVFME